MKSFSLLWEQPAKVLKSLPEATESEGYAEDAPPVEEEEEEEDASSVD